MQRYETLITLAGQTSTNFWMDGLREIFGGTLDEGHLNELMTALSTRNLIPIECSDPILSTLAGVGGPVSASVALYYGVSVIGPIALLAVPAGVFLLYVAKPAGEGVGAWLKRWLDSCGVRSTATGAG